MYNICATHFDIDIHEKRHLSFGLVVSKEKLKKFPLELLGSYYQVWAGIDYIEAQIEFVKPSCSLPINNSINTKP